MLHDKIVSMYVGTILRDLECLFLNLGSALPESYLVFKFQSQITVLSTNIFCKIQKNTYNTSK